MFFVMFIFVRNLRSVQKIGFFLYLVIDRISETLIREIWKAGGLVYGKSAKF